MPNIVANIKKNYRNLLILLLIVVSVPLWSTIIDVIFTYGTYVGSYARTIIDSGICK